MAAAMLAPAMGWMILTAISCSVTSPSATSAAKAKNRYSHSGSLGQTQRIGRRRISQNRRKSTQTFAQYQGNNVNGDNGLSVNGHHMNGSIQTKRRVVITGMGVVSPFGTDVDEFYDVLLEGKSGVSRIQGFDVTNFPTKIAAEVRDLNCDGYVSKKWIKRTDKYIKYGLVAGKKALEHSKLTEIMENLDKQRCGILVGSALGGIQAFTDAVWALTHHSHRRMNPFCIPFATTNMGGAMLAMDTGFMGPNYSINTACATGNYCILSAADHILRGDADVMLAGGSEAAVQETGLGGFVACRALSTRNDAPEQASRPWDKNRDGFVMGEGAGVLVLEELEHAKARGANILAELLGGSFTCDAHHMTEPNPKGKGVSLAIRNALSHSGVNPDDVNYVNAHATSTKAGDMAEYGAIREVLPAKDMKINATKSMIGHTLGAAGALEAIVTVQAIVQNRLHPNINLDDPEDGIDTGILVGNVHESHDIKVALSNSFGFGGHNSSLLFAPFHENGAHADATMAS